MQNILPIKVKRMLSITISMFIAISVVMVSRAEEPSKETDKTSSENEIMILDEITVTAYRTEKDIFSTPTGMNVVNQAKILQEQPRAISEALRDEPGLWIQKTGHIGGAPVIRGLMGKQILLLVDGVRYNSLNSYSGPNSWINTIDISDIERIEVIRGPGSVLYGTDALGGVINVITKKNHRFSDKFEFHPSLSNRYGSADQSSAEKLELSASSSRFNLLASGDIKDIGDLIGGRGEGIMSPSGWKEKNYNLNGSAKLSDNHILDLSYQNFHRYDVTRFDRPGYLSTGDRQMLLLTYQGNKISPFISQIKTDIAYHDREDGQKSQSSVDDSFTKTETIQAETQATSLIGEAQRAVYGIHYHRDTTDGWTNNKSGYATSPNATWDNFGAFLQDEISLLSKLSLTPALRYDWYQINRDKDQNAAGDIGIDQNNKALTGSLGAVYSLTEILNIVATVGYGFRAPNNSDYNSAPSLFTYGVSVPVVNILNPEKSTNYEIGIRLKHDRIQAAVSTYYMVVSDLIGSQKGTYKGQNWYDWNADGVRDPDEDVYITTNIGEEYIYGTDLQASLLLTDSWNFSGIFSYITGRNRTEDQPLDRAFPINSTLSLFWREPKTGRFWAEFSTRLVNRFDAKDVPSDRLASDPAFKVNPQDRKSALLGGDGSIPGYAIYNLRCGVKVTDWADLTFGVENLTNKKYRDKDSRIDAPGINFVAALTLKP